ncbi:MAG TPA: hypothetical protein VGS19_00100 [Streptosporangiaceae bacterium]|nr:hypothetical protein [Streptosporangiaceae bacterium]
MFARIVAAVLPPTHYSASTRRRTTTQWSPAGMASASRHSVATSPTQRLRQISVPGSYNPPQTCHGSDGVTE